MGIKSVVARILAWAEYRKVSQWSRNPHKAQKREFDRLRSILGQCAYGREHHIYDDLSYEDWKLRIPVRDYEAMSPWVNRIKRGERDVLWPGVPRYFCKTSGTTSGTKYIPMSEEGIQAQIRAARQTLLLYIRSSGNASFVDGKMIFLQGSPVLEKVNGIDTGRLSGIVAHHVPSYLQKNRMPSLEVNSIEDWEEKVDAIVEETMNADMRLISGIPPWVQMYLEKLLERAGETSVSDVFPKFSVFIHGGVNYVPYLQSMERLIGRSIDHLETYPASEGFIAFQDTLDKPGLLLNLDAGIFYEFIPTEDFYFEYPRRLRLQDIEIGVNYAIILNTSSGLWGYLLGDTVKFVSKAPYRIVVTGRTKHFISAFGEHVIADEVDKAMSNSATKYKVEVSEFHVAPQVNPVEGLPFHEWFVEIKGDIPDGFGEFLDGELRSLNTYYNDLITGSVLRPLKLTAVKPGTFNAYMKSVGRLGGQNKLPRLSNDRTIADALTL